MLETGGVAGLGQRHAVPDLVPRAEQALCVDIFTDAAAGLFLEKLHEVTAADEKFFGESLDGEIVV